MQTLHFTSVSAHLRYLLTGLLLLLAPAAHAQDAYRWLWATQPTLTPGLTTGQTGVESQAGPVATDAADNVYFAATGTGQGNPLNLTYLPAVSLGGVPLAVDGWGANYRRATYGIAKLNAGGTYQWVQNLTNTDFHVHKLATDPAGNVYVLGTAAARDALASTGYSFGSSPVSFGNKTGTFIAKLSSGGLWQWATKVDVADIVGGQSDGAQSYDLAVRQNGNSVDVFIAGFNNNGTATFGSSGLTTASSSGRLFVAKLDGTTGGWQWVRAGGGLDVDFYASNGGAGTLPSGIAVVPSTGEVFVTGQYYRNGTASCAFGASMLPATPAGAYGVFVAKLTAAGAWSWAVGGSGSKLDGTAASVFGTSIVADASGNAYLGGGMSADLLALGTLPAMAWPGSFVAKINGSGVWQWASNILGTQSSADRYNQTTIQGFAVKLASTGELLAATSAYSDLTIGGQTYPSNGGSDLLCVRFSTAGIPQRAVRLGGNDHDYLSGFALDSQNNPCLTGYYSSTTLPNGLTNTGSYLHDYTGFLAKAVPAQAPAITSVTPASSLSGATITITGTGFYNVSSVTILNAAVPSFTVNPTGTSITATVPAAAPGSGLLVVRTPSGDATANFQVVAVPTVSSFTPTSGTAGATVTVSGTNFQGATSVKFNGVSTTAFTVLSNSSLTVTVPAGATTGKVSVSNPAGTGVSAASFTVGIAPAITSFTPTTGAAGTSFTISGTALGSATSVKIGSVPCTVTANSATSITATVPNATAGAVNVTTAFGTATAGTFTPTAPQPTITSFSPASGAAGSNVTVTGTNLNWLTGAAINGAAATVTAVSATSLTLTVPATSTGRITVGGTSSTATSATDFTVPVPTAPDWSRTTLFGGAGHAEILGTATDAASNLYVTGKYLNGAISFALQDGSTRTLPTLTGSSGGFLAKLRPDGQWEWAVALSSSGNVTPYGVAVDARGNATVVGKFDGTMSVSGRLGGSATCVSAGGSDAFAARYPAAGTAPTLARGGSTRDDEARAVALDATGAAYVAGQYYDGLSPAGFGFGSFGDDLLVLIGNSYNGTFLAKLATTGEWTWAYDTTIPDAGSSETFAVAVSPVTGNVTAAGYYREPGTDAARGLWTTFSADGTSNGNALVLGRDNAVGSYSSVVAAAYDPSGNLVLSGAFTGIVGLGASGSQSLTSQGTNDLFVARYSSANALQWSARAGNTIGGVSSSIQPTGIAIDAGGNITLVGQFAGSASFGATPLINAGSPPHYDLFVTRLSSAGAWQWAKSVGTPADESIGSVALDAAGNVLVSARLSGSTTFAPLPAVSPTNGGVIARLGNTALPAPIITSFTPTSGTAGTSVTIVGTNLLGYTGVVFVGAVSNSVTVPDTMITVASATAITLRVPPGAATGPLRVITSGGIATSATNFTVSAPTITGFSPTSGGPGTAVTVLGTGFPGATAVKVNGTAASSFTVSGNSTIYVTVPGGATTGTVQVVTPNGTASSAATFTILAAPTISSFSPASGPVGTNVTITGTNFTGVSAVTLNGAAVSYTVNSATSITATVPAGGQSGLLAVYTNGGQAPSATTFSVTATAAPVISSFSPINGPVGTSVTITGTNLAGATSLTFNGTAATITANTATSITSTVPSGATTGALSVTTAGGTAMSGTSFQVTAGALPMISSFSPSSGPVGSSVTLTGTNFTGVTYVAFNGTAATFTVNSATSITTTVPNGATTGQVAVGKAGVGTTGSTGNFTVTAAQPPTITSFSPTSGAPGTSVTITGTNLGSATAVSFNGTAASITSATGTTLVTTVPSGATSGAIMVTNLAGGTSSSTVFTVTGAATGWPALISSTQNEAGRAVVTDAGGNVYVAGYFSDVATFGPITLTAVGGQRDAYVAKYSSAGTPQWAMALGGTGDEQIRGLTLDTGGNLYITGDFTTDFTYPVGSGVTNLTNPNGSVGRAFVGLLSAASGDVQWLLGLGGTTASSAADVAADANGNVYVGGYFGGTFDLEGSALILNGAGGTDGFVACLSTGSGQWTWATRAGGTGYEAVTGLALDASANVYIAGFFSSSNFGFSNGAATLTSAGGYDVWVARLAPATGAVSWAQRAGSAASDDYGQDVAVATSTVAVLAYGNAASSIGTTSVTPNAGGTWGAVGRLSLAGTWQAGVTALSVGASTSAIIPTRLMAVSSGAATVAGYFGGDGATFGATTLTAANSSDSFSDAFVARTTDAGTGWAWVQQLGGNGARLSGEAVALNTAGDSFLAGTFTGSFTQNASTLAASAEDAFLTRFAAPPAAPTISSFTPTSGPTGTQVTITGTNLSGTTGASVNNVAATFTVLSATSVKLTVPTAATTGLLRLTTAGGTATSATSFTVTAPALPTITSFSPTSGPVGTVVTITGTNLTGTSAVSFGGASASVFNASSATTATATVPSGAATGVISLTATGGTATSTTSFTVTTGSPPAITSFTPTSGPIGAMVTITGTNFTGATAVSFNNVAAAAFTINSATSISATVPGTASTGAIRVTTPGGTATSASNFTVVPAPTITSFSPTSGPVGTSVTITGTNFGGTTGVTINNVTASLVSVAPTAVTVTVPAGATTGAVRLTTPGGTATGASFTVTVAAPTLTSFTPTSGSSGTSVTLTGTNFTGATAVAFNGTAATFTVGSATSITTAVPAGATTGTITVTTPGGMATSATSFTVPAGTTPTITAFSPAAGTYIGQTVTITGTNLSSATVRFNGTVATVTANTATSITTTVPAGATTGPLTATTAGGVATAPASFNVAPYISALSPTSGPVGTTVVITGTSLTGATLVKFNATAAASYTVNSATQITAVVAAGTTTGKVTVTTPSGTRVTGASFTVTTSPVPTITAFSPTSGPVGTSVTITGTNLTGASAVSFNNVAATSFTVNSATSITATVPAGATTGAVRVITPGGTATGASFTVTVAAPTLTSFTPTSGSSGTSVTLTGTNFTGATAVAFNGTAATFTVGSATSITTAVPAGATTGMITVTTPGGTATSATSFTVPAGSGPTITALSPTAAVGQRVGQPVVITGTNLTGATAVKFNGASATFTVNSTTQITATVPASATTGPITVTTPSGTSAPTASYAIIPYISAFSPTSGPVGTTVVITGTSLTGATLVKFNATAAASYTVNSATQITAVVAAGTTTGKVTVTTPSGTRVTGASFTVTTSPVPTITAFSPTSGPVGTSVTITGTGFLAVSAVSFNGTNATSFAANAAGTSLTATVPNGTISGTISVTTPGGLATSATTFTVTVPAPTVTSFSPAAGTYISAAVTITGTNFTGATSVKFNGTAATFSVASATSITTTVPAGATTGTLSVTTPNGTATAPTTFNVTPYISAFTPTSGPVGTTVVITGTSLTGATLVKFNTTAAASYTVNSATQITAVVAAGTTTGKVTVTTPSGTRVTGASFTVTTARPVRAVVAPPEPAMLALWPVPATTQLTLTLKGGPLAMLSVAADVISSTGGIVFRQALLPLGAGRYQATIRLDELPSGVYWVRVPGAPAARLLKE